MATLLRSVVLFAVALTGQQAVAADGTAINEAVRRGAEFLRRVHAPNPTYTGGTHGLGQSALAGIAMLEAGVPPADPSVQQVTLFVRTRALSETQTYDLALALIFLDRLKDPRDEPLIQVLGVRLYHGLNVAGGWTYGSWDAIPQNEAQRLAYVLYPPGGRRPPPTPAPDKPPDTGFPTAPRSADPRPNGLGSLHPEAARQLIAVRREIAVSGRPGVGDDNSNTQFGLVALWVATRHGLVVDDAFALIETRFLRTQNRNDGGWSYSGGGNSTPAMTCAGLLGLAAGAGVRDTALTGAARPNADPSDGRGRPDDPFFNPAEPAPTGESVGVPGTPANFRDAAIKAALTSLGQVLATGKQQAGNGPADFSNFVGHGNPYYVLWSIERVAVAFGLKRIGGVDWHDLGAGYLLANQQPTGAWHHSQYDDDINTSFAMLFLLKANFTANLTDKLKDKVTDPGRAELRGGGAAPVLYAPPRAAPARPSAAALPAGVTSLPDASTAINLKLPEVVDLTPADQLAGTIVGLPDADWEAELDQLKTARGGVHTLGLAWAIGRLDGDRRRDVRDTLAERLARMTPDTLRELLRDPEVEIRRAATLACAMRDDKGHIPDLIERITDPSEVVVRAARAGLRSMTGEDFGPPSGSNAEVKLKAATDWRTWYDKRSPNR